MIRWLSSNILGFIQNNMETSPEMKEVYEYGIEITISTILNVVLIVVSSIIVGDIAAGLIYLFIFMFLRSFTGGYHAATYFRCNATFVLTFLITFLLYKIMVYYEVPVLICAAIAFLDLIPVLCLSPVPNKNKPLTEKQRKRSYKLSIMIASVISLIGLSFLVSGIKIGVMIITTLTTVSVLMIIEIILQRRGIHAS